MTIQKQITYTTQVARRGRNKGKPVKTRVLKWAIVRSCGDVVMTFKTKDAARSYLERGLI